MLKWIGVPAVGLLAMLPTASNAQVTCGIPAARTGDGWCRTNWREVIMMDNGGIFQPNRMWSAISSIVREKLCCR